MRRRQKELRSGQGKRGWRGETTYINTQKQSSVVRTPRRKENRRPAGVMFSSSVRA